MSTALLISLLPYAIPILLVFIHKYTPFLDQIAGKVVPDLEKMLEEELKKASNPDKKTALMQAIVDLKALPDKK